MKEIRVIFRLGKRKVYSEKLDLGELREYWDEVATNGANPQLEGVTFEEYHRPLVISSNDLALYNGKHFIYGQVESILQSDCCPHSLRDVTDFEIEVAVS